jgi:S1-C subfamily serine protease
MRRILPAIAVLALLPAFSIAEETVYKRALKSTVWIVQPISREGNKIMLRTGSGAVIDVKQKLILTNYHVVEEIPDAIICFPIFDKQGKLIPEKDKYSAALKDIGLKGRVIARDSSKDLALIKLDVSVPLPAATPALRMARTTPEPGEKVHSIGSPGLSGALFNYTGGEVKSVYHKDWKAMRIANDPNPLQLSAKVIETSSGTNKGDSGGPLLNDKCELVGVTQGGNFGAADANPISYFIAIEEVRDLLKRNKITISTPAAGSAVAADKPKETPMTTGDTTTAPVDAKKLEADAANKLDLAKQLASSGKIEKARERYEEIVKKFPGTKAADEAKALLEKK